MSDYNVQHEVIHDLTEHIVELEAENAALSKRLAEAETMLQRAYEALEGYIDWHGGCHTTDCPEDDTCDCKGKTTNDLVNALFRLRVEQREKQSNGIVSEK